MRFFAKQFVTTAQFLRRVPVIDDLVFAAQRNLRRFAWRSRFQIQMFCGGVVLCVADSSDVCQARGRIASGRELARKVAASTGRRLSLIPWPHGSMAIGSQKS